eukprot:15478605-Alexandrium_andersonii.AAC.1
MEFCCCQAEPTNTTHVASSLGFASGCCDIARLSARCWVCWLLRALFGVSKGVGAWLGVFLPVTRLQLHQPAQHIPSDSERSPMLGMCPKWLYTRPCSELPLPSGHGLVLVSDVFRNRSVPMNELLCNGSYIPCPRSPVPARS